MTLDKKYVVVDAHNHYVPKEAVAKAGKTEGISCGARSLNPSIAYQKLFDIESNLCQMGDCGMDMAGLLREVFYIEWWRIFEIAAALGERIHGILPGSPRVCPGTRKQQ